MAQLKDVIVTGPTRLIGDAYANSLQVTTIKAPTSTAATAYSAGTDGQVLKSNGSITYWAEDEPNAEALSSIETMLSNYGLFSNANLQTARTDTAETNRAVVSQ